MEHFVYRRSRRRNNANIKVRPFNNGGGDFSLIVAEEIEGEIGKLRYSKGKFKIDLGCRCLVVCSNEESRSPAGNRSRAGDKAKSYFGGGSGKTARRRGFDQID